MKKNTTKQNKLVARKLSRNELRAVAGGRNTSSVLQEKQILSSTGRLVSNINQQ
jgi:hypothetical protein